MEYIDPKELEKINLTKAERERFRAMVASPNREKLLKLLEKAGKNISKGATSATKGAVRLGKELTEKEMISGVTQKHKETMKPQKLKVLPKGYKRNGQ